MKEILILPSIVSGLTTAILWALLLWLVNTGRNLIVEKKLRKALSRIGTHYGDEGFGVIIKNETNIPILIRDVTLLTEKSEEGIGLQYHEPIADFLIAEKRTKKPQQFNTKTRSKRLNAVLTPHGFVELPPYTGGVWQLDPGFYFENPELKPVSCRATVEYKTFLKNPKLIIVQSNEGNIQLLRDQYFKFLDYIREKIEVNP